MGSTGKFEEEDRRAARNFATSSRQAGVRRIIYLGGLGAEEPPLSTHLRSRQEVADILRSSEVPTIEFRASIVIGSGSLSFEMIRALVQRLPVMICPRWVNVKAQPIAVEDVIAYLLAALESARRTGLHIRDRWRRPSQLRRDHARVCAAMRPSSMDDPGSGPDASPFEFVVGPGHAYLCACGP